MDGDSSYLPFGLSTSALLWALAAVVVVVAASVIALVGFSRGWWGGRSPLPDEAAFKRELEAVERDLAAVEAKLRARPVIGLATAQDVAARAEWEKEQRLKQEPPDDDDGFLADGASDDEHLRSSVARRRAAAQPTKERSKQESPVHAASWRACHGNSGAATQPSTSQ